MAKAYTKKDIDLDEDVSLDEEITNENFGEKTKVKNKKFSTALLLSIFLGMLGVDRFYLGGKENVIMGLIKMLTGGAYGIWWIIDIYSIATKKIKNVNFE